MRLWQNEEDKEITSRTTLIAQPERPSTVHISLQRHGACAAAAAKASASPSRCALRGLPSHMLIAACMQTDHVTEIRLDGGLLESRRGQT